MSTQNISTLTIGHFSTPIGQMLSCASEKGICLLDFTDKKLLKTELKIIAKKYNTEILPGTHRYLDQLQVELAEYFAGTRKKFTVPVHTLGTDFQQSAWDRLRQIPYAETRSYKQQATAINKPKAVRAVAAANSHNRISIVIPCHRVIGSDGRLVGYAGGLHRKKWLLDFESSNVQSK